MAAFYSGGVRTCYTVMGDYAGISLGMTKDEVLIIISYTAMIQGDKYCFVVNCIVNKVSKLYCA